MKKLQRIPTPDLNAALAGAPWACPDTLQWVPWGRDPTPLLRPKGTFREWGIGQGWIPRVPHLCRHHPRSEGRSR